jgi:hypothetical protein
MSLVGWRTAALFNVATIMKLDHDDIHFICVLEAPKIIPIVEYLSAAPTTFTLTQPTAEFPTPLPGEPALLSEVPVPEEEDFSHWFLRFPRADFGYWFQSGIYH